MAVNSQELVEKARGAVAGAYAPYSQFRVGAAVITASGKIYTGANVENASYGLTLCAERLAAMKAAVEGETELKAVAVATEQGIVKSPCGACLQVLAEFIKDDSTPIYLSNVKSKDVVERRFSDFVPYPCRIETLKKSAR